MRASPLSVIAVVALLVLSGCVGLPNAGENQPPPDVSPDEFPNASEIDQSVFDTHATEMGNTSFTLTFEQNRTDRNPSVLEDDFSHMNDTSRTLVEPDASQYLEHTTGYFSGNGSTYSNGSTEYVLSRENDWTEVRKLSPVSMFNESGEYYLWRGVFNNDSDLGYDFAAIDATYEREGVEWFQGVPVMRYEATGVDALPDRWAGGENASSNFEEFSATLLLDEDGVIRHYEYTFEKPPEHRSRLRFSRAYTLSDVGSTDVEKPDWVANATAGS
ncbi:hypothetical protein Htur_1300 [Haloterrigena turkmenica DSM 5511]|uniref:Lipoprotein n=1 Tax=Haloterrigena turkmenica (strain ATCC 51198 / DSM 5511 / JCM 9101 / NCIMB 13204 / VKM B-1734 / 4k) TaxID=543526 RepID=D2RPF6_HALTV|nr:hypothetical protein [Haloterrigena turkmenica]ADB60190.1 hypothetical protein Htur_1300 [Haloterrigena turkmenica DSM 5511]